MCVYVPEEVQVKHRPQWIFIQEVLSKVQKKAYNSLEGYSEDPQKLQKLSESYIPVTENT